MDGDEEQLVMLAGPSLRRFGLVRDQVHFLGNYSLAIIAVSGLFVGFVLGLQGYYTLQRYGSSEALGLLVALSLVRELGPVVTALLFAGLAMARRRWARTALLVTAAASAGACVLSAFYTPVSLVPGLASIATVILLRRPEVRAWFR